MSECRRTIAQLAPYHDGMLSAAEQADVERHLEACPPCRLTAEHAEGGRRVVRERVEPLRDAPLPPGLRSRCESLLQASSAASPWRRRWVPVLAIAALVIATGLALLAMETRRSDRLLVWQLTADHWKCDHLFTSSDAPPLDAGEAEAILAARYGWEDLQVPPSSPADGITLIHARRCVYAAGTIPHVIYRVGGQDMSLFILDGVTRRAAEVFAMGYQSRIWTRGTTTYVLVHPRGGREVNAAATYVMQQARGPGSRGR